jgi:Protein of unknown function (DUF3987)
MGEHHARIEFLEQKPELLRKVEMLDWVGGHSRDQAVTSATSAPDDWPDPEPLGGELPPVPAFDSHLLPAALRPLAEDTAERMQVPLDYPAVVAVLCLAGGTGRRATIQPKAEDTSWVVTPNLWGGIIAPPGLMKSPVISLLTQPLTRIEALWRAEYESAISGYQQQQEEMELRRAAWREQFKAAQKRGTAAPARPDDSIAEPVCGRLITQDATMEKLHEIMHDNPAGILVIRDELSGWLATLDKPGREGERGFFLSAWNGDTGYTMDRIGRGSIHVEACCVSMLAGIQPARLRSYLADALHDGPLNDGLLQRFQVLVYPDIPQDWRYVDRAPRREAISNAQHMYHRLAPLDAAQPLRFRFDGDAQELFVAWLTDLEGKLRGVGLHPALVSHLAKYRKLMPALALLFELADGGVENVSLEHARQSAAFCDYLESHARRIYSMIISPERQAAAELGRHLAAGWKRTEAMFTVRDVYQNDWRALATPDAVHRALAIVDDAGWVRPAPLENKTAGGRPRELYAINPRVWRGEMSTSRWLTWTPPNSRIIEESLEPEPPKPPKPGFEGFAGATPRLFQKIEPTTPTPERSRHAPKPESLLHEHRRSAFPHCPRCFSFALYRGSSAGNYECQTCLMQDIDPAVARRLN